jgi:PrcB C-terminal
MKLCTLLSFAVAATFLVGCAQPQRVDVTTVLANDNCRTDEPGVRAIDYAALAAFQGTHLIGMTESEESAQRPLHLVAIAGEFPTPGYSISLQEGTKITAGVLTIRIKTERPPQDAMLSQVITHPCLVVGVADPAVSRVKVLDESAAVLGEVDLSAPKKP